MNQKIETLYFTDRLVNQRTDLKRINVLHIKFGLPFGKLKSFINNSLVKDILLGSNEQIEVIQCKK